MIMTRMIVRWRRMRRKGRRRRNRNMRVMSRKRNRRSCRSRLRMIMMMMMILKRGTIRMKRIRMMRWWNWEEDGSLEWWRSWGWWWGDRGWGWVWGRWLIICFLVKTLESIARSLKKCYLSWLKKDNTSKFDLTIMIIIVEDAGLRLCCYRWA